MARIDNSINNLLSNMHSNRGVDKGSVGEQAVFKICEKFYQTEGGILVHSYTHKVDPEQKGNIKKGENGQLYIENLGDITEIDILYISKYRIFPIEVKAYRAKQITLDDRGIYGCYKTDKSPVHQNEMHCRHFYSFMLRALENGDTDYIVPIVCMVDKCQLIDNRSYWQRNYIHLCVLNTLEDTIRQYNTPKSHQMDLVLCDKLLKEGMIKSEIYLPPRI